MRRVDYGSEEILSVTAIKKSFTPTLLPAVVALDRGVNYTSLFDNAKRGCLSGGVCCSSTSTTLLEANSTIYTAYHMDVPKIYRQSSTSYLFIVNKLVCTPSVNTKL